MVSSPWIFVCPSSRGIGHALTRLLLRTTSLPILATTRSTNLSSAKESLLSGLDKDDAITAESNGGEKKTAKSPDIDMLAPRLSLVTCDVLDEQSIQEAASKAAELFPPESNHLRLAFAIPGMLKPEKSPAQIDAEKSLEMFRVNSIGPLLLMKHFGGFLPKRSTKMADKPTTSSSSDQESPSAEANDPQMRIPSMAIWLSMSARVGSTTDNRAGGWYSYRASKAAVASLAKTHDNYLRAQTGDASAMSVAYHPGTVKTELSREFWESVPKEKLFSVEYAAERMAKVVEGMGGEHRGRVWDWKGEEVPP